jgi:hypothetical protein
MARKPEMLPMKWGQVLLCGWPGLAHLWLRGSFLALGGAIAFSVSLNLAVIATFVWPAIFGAAFPAIVWPILLLLWLVSGWISLRSVERLAMAPRMASDRDRETVGSPIRGHADNEKQSETDDVTPDTLFNRAQLEYLRGNWIEAEDLLNRQLRGSERDIESRLLLATLFRRSGQTEKAREQLMDLQKFDESIHWKYEIRRELQLHQGCRDAQPNHELD